VLEAAFLIALAVVAGFAEFEPTTIVLVMGAAWLLVAVIEWLAWREGPRVVHVAREEAPPPPAAVEPLADVREEEAPRRRFWRRRRTDEPAEAVAEPGEDTQDLEAPEQPAPAAAEDRSRT
jgi:hypothetical protein